MNEADSQKRYRDYPTYLKTLFRGRVQKLSIDGGFSCPNRDGTRGRGGCTFCNNRSFSPGYCRATAPVSRQVEEGKGFFAHKYAGQKYLAYFQSYTSTYAPLSELKRKYGEALQCRDIVGIVIGTRPDAVDEEILDYIQELSRKVFVCVEYGVESTDDGVLLRINRGHTYAESERAIRLTAERGIHTGAHIIFGLPGESRRSMLEGVVRLCDLPVDVVKLHQLQIIRGTAMAEEYLMNPDDFRLYTLEEYLDFVTDVIERVRPDVYFERFVNQVPDEYLIAPKWEIRNYEFVAKLERQLREKGAMQGKRHV